MTYKPQLEPGSRLDRFVGTVLALIYGLAFVAFFVYVVIPGNPL